MLCVQCTRFGGWTGLDMDSLTLSPTTYTITRLATKDDTVADKPDKEPIVVLIYKGRRLVIDGRRRINRWIEQKDHTPRRALIITPKERKLE